MKKLIIIPFLLAACGEVTTGGDAAAPTISAISPDRGGTPGGATITITGTGFVDNDAGENHVVVGGREAENVDPVDDATLTFALPANDEENAVADIIIFNNNGFAVADRAITYNQGPRIFEHVAPIGSKDGGETISIRGSGFENFDPGDVKVLVGATEATDVQVISDNELTAATPPRPAGVKGFEPLDLTVETANGSATVPGAFRFVGPGLLGIGNPRQDASFFFIDPTDGRVEALAPTNGLAAAAMAPNDVLFAVTARRIGPPNLVTVDPLTGERTVLGPIPNGETITDMLFVGANLFGAQRSNNDGSSRLVTINTTNGTTNPIGAGTLPTVNRGITLATRDATTIFGLTDLNQAVKVITLSNGNTVEGATMTGGANVRAHAALHLGNDLFVIGHNSQPTAILFKLDPQSGELTEVTQIPNMTALTVTPASFE
jgi:hypothetical protein